MQIDMSGRVALITGGSKGLGFASAERFIRSGAQVAIIARDSVQLDSAVERLNALAPGQAAGFTCDVTHAEQIEATFAAVQARFDKVDILLNNAGEHAHGEFETLTDAQWQHDLDLKLFPVIRFSRLALPGMKERRWGRILNSINVFAKAPRANTAPTCVSRAATMALTKALAGECAPYNVLINALAIGIIESDQFRRGYANSDGSQSYDQYMQAKAVSLGIPLQRAGQPREFADLACFLASDAGSFITGSVINVDGGMCPVV